MISTMGIQKNTFRDIFCSRMIQAPIHLGYSPNLSKLYIRTILERMGFHSSGDTTACPTSSDLFYIVRYYLKWVTTSWKYSRSFFLLFMKFFFVFLCFLWSFFCVLWSFVRSFFCVLWSFVRSFSSFFSEVLQEVFLCFLKIFWWSFFCFLWNI